MTNYRVTTAIRDHIFVYGENTRRMVATSSSSQIDKPGPRIDLSAMLWSCQNPEGRMRNTLKRPLLLRRALLPRLRTSIHARLKSWHKCLDYLHNQLYHHQEPTWTFTSLSYTSVPSVHTSLSSTHLPTAYTSLSHTSLSRRVHRPQQQPASTSASSPPLARSWRQGFQPPNRPCLGSQTYPTWVPVDVSKVEDEGAERKRGRVE